MIRRLAATVVAFAVAYFGAHVVILVAAEHGFVGFVGGALLTILLAFTAAYLVLGSDD